MSKRFLVTALALSLVPIAGTAAAASTDPVVPIVAPHASDRIIVAFTPGAPAAAKAAARSSAGASSQEILSPLATDSEVFHLPAGRSPEQAIAALKNNPNVRYAEPDYLRTTADTSNDPYVTGGSLWGMYGDTSAVTNQYGSQAMEVWEQGYTGSSTKYVVVIDEGVDVRHGDLAANIWVNPGEIAGNKIDDDGNGYVDDVNGYDFYNNDGTVYDGGNGDKHGTHVSGTIGGVGGNGIGVAGVNWKVKIISAKFLGPNGGYTSDAVRAVDYATALKTSKGLDIVATSNSWGGGGADQSLQEAIVRGGDANILFIAAAGNASSNNDSVDNYPSNYSCAKKADGSNRGWDCVVAVASTTSTGGLSSFSNYGRTTVDLGAPGSGIYSTLPGNNYGSYSGTSMATPHVSGAAALCSSIGGLTGGSLRAALMSAVAPTASLADTTVSGGRLDLTDLVTICGGSASTPPLVITTTTLPRARVGVNYSATLQASGGTSPYSWTVSGLPAGLTVSGNTISGVPTTAGSSTVSVSVSDAGSPAQTKTMSPSPTIVVDPALIATSLGSFTPGSTTRKASVRLTAILSANGTGLNGVQVTFTFNGRTCTAGTSTPSGGAAGTASCTITAPGSRGTFTATARYAGNSTYASTSGSWQITVG